MPRCGSSACWSRRRRRSNSSSESSAPPDGKKLGFLQRNPKLRKVVSKGQALLYIVLNGILPAIDVISDVFTFVELLDSSNPKWAFTSLFCIFLPFTVKMLMFVKEVCQGKASLENLAGLFLHFPLVSPLIFATLGLHLLILDATEAENSATIETIQKVAALGSLYESFFEAGPQLLVQLNIVSCTGRVSHTQLFSMSSSIVTLSLTSARAYYIQRDIVHADPAPNPHMLLRALPWNFLQVVSSAIQWAYVANLKELIFVVFALSGSFTWFVLWAVEKMTKTKLDNPVELHQVLVENEPAGTNQEIPPGLVMDQQTPVEETPETEKLLAVGKSQQDGEKKNDKVTENEITQQMPSSPEEVSQLVVEMQEQPASTEEESLPEEKKDSRTDSRHERNAGSGETKEEREIESVITQQPSSIPTQVEKPKEFEEGEEKSIQKTCHALCQCLCTIGLCVLFPCTSRCCKCVESGNEGKISFYLASGPGFLGKELKRRFTSSFLAYSSGMTTLLKEPVQGEDQRFFRLKASMTSIFDSEVYISSLIFH